MIGSPVHKITPAVLSRIQAGVFELPADAQLVVGLMTGVISVFAGQLRASQKTVAGALPSTYFPCVDHEAGVFPGASARTVCHSIQLCLMSACLFCFSCVTPVRGLKAKPDISCLVVRLAASPVATLGI